MKRRKKVSIVVPSYNEQLSIMAFFKELSIHLKKIPYKSEVIFVDDGSTDNTLQMIKDLCHWHDNVHFIELSRNHGHQAALKAGLDLSTGDCVISIDCDLQQPPSMIPEMIKKWEEGYEVVYTKRQEDKKLPFFKRFTSKMFYKLLNKLSDVEIEEGTADFRLLDKKAVDLIRKLSENDLFFRGIVKWIGYKQTSINYKPNSRCAGESKYTIKKMFALAINGITSFSIKPLYFAVYLGLAFSILSVLYIPYVFYSMASGQNVEGWVSLLVTVVFFSGLNLLIVGLIGIYLGKTFMQSKNRPLYIIRSTNMILANYWQDEFALGKNNEVRDTVSGDLFVAKS